MPCLLVGMSLNSSDAPQDRIVSILRKMDDDATALKSETKALQEARDQWAPAKVGGRTVLMPGDKTLSSRCSNQLEQASGYERQINLHARRERTGERELQRAVEQREAVQSAAEAAGKDAERRRVEAEKALEDLQKRRREAEKAYAAARASEETNNEAELALIERKIEATWKQAAAHSSNARRDAAAQRARGQREIAEANADFERWSTAYERSLEEYDASCDAGVTAAHQRVLEAEVVAQKAWEDCDVQMQSFHTEADGQVQERNVLKDSAVVDTNKQLIDEEEQLESELVKIKRSEEVAREDRTAEERVKSFQNEVAEDMQQRREWCDARVQENLDTVARLTKEAADGAASAARRAQAAQTRSDRQVEAITVDVEKFADSNYKGKILELQSNLKDVIAAANHEFTQRLQAFREQTDKQTRRADEALVKADRKVEEVRVWAGGLMDQTSQSLSGSIKDIRGERERVVTESFEKVRQTQNQMVQYVGSQFEDMLESLSKTQPLGVPLQLDYSAAVEV